MVALLKEVFDGLTPLKHSKKKTYLHDQGTDNIGGLEITEHTTDIPIRTRTLTVLGKACCIPILGGW